MLGEPYVVGSSSYYPQIALGDTVYDLNASLTVAGQSTCIVRAFRWRANDKIGIQIFKKSNEAYVDVWEGDKWRSQSSQPFTYYLSSPDTVGYWSPWDSSSQIYQDIISGAVVEWED